MMPNLDLQRIWEEAMKIQREFVETVSSMMKLISGFSLMNKNVAVFRARIQAGGRISIPEAEKAALRINDGDIVKVIVIKEGGEKYGDEGFSGSG